MKTKLLLMLVVVGLAAGVAGANMLLNPSFEEGTFEANDPPAYWVDSSPGLTSNMTWFDDAAGAHTGSKYIKMNSFWSYSSSAWCWQEVDVTAGEEYAFSVWAKCPVPGETSEAWARYAWLGSSSNIISEGWLPWSLDVGGNWTHVEFGTATAPEAATQVFYRLVGALENGGMGVLFDDAYMDTPVPSLPSPAWESLVPVGDVDLSWTNLAPNDPNGSVYVDVWFGTEPNETDPDYQMDKIVDATTPAGEDANSVTVEDLAIGTYYWRVNSYLNGSPTGDPIKGLAWSFDVVADAPPSSLDAGPDMITWSDEAVQLDAMVEDDGESELIYDWSWDALAGSEVLLSATNIENPTVTIRNISSREAAIVNPSFEDRLDGWESFGVYNGTWDGTWMGRTYIYPTDGDMVAYLMGNYGDPIKGAWISQTLAETLTAETTYTLTVDVINDGVYNEDVEYRVQLLAGETVVAEDNDSIPLDPVPPGTSSDWATSTVVFSLGTVGGPSDPNFVYVGEPLGIRLVAKYVTEDMSFDNVHLTAEPPFPAPEVSTVELAVMVNDAANPTYVLKDRMTVDVYSDACAAAIGAGLSAENPGDIDGNCITNLEDLVLALETWLNDTSLMEAVVKPAGPVSTGTISYVPITGDADSGISADNTYTHAIDFGVDTPAALVNGVQFQTGNPDFGPITGTSATIGTGTSSVPSAHDGDDAADPYLDGEAYCAMEDLVEDMTYNDATTVITLTGLTPGAPYQFRLYHRSWGGTRPQDIGFDTDGIGMNITGAEDTAVFFEDDATQPDPSFTTATQVYALTYDYRLSPGVTTLTVYINQTGTGTYHLYGLTNQAFGPMDPSPADGGYVHPSDELELSWTNMDPNNPSDSVYVDVWFGTDPNDYNDFNKIVDAGENVSSVTVDASTEGTYYWQVDSYINGADKINEPNMIEGRLWKFHTVTDIPVSVNAGGDVVAWSGEAVQLDGTVDDDGVSALTYTWSAEPADGVVFEPNEFVEDPTVTITKTPGFAEIIIINAGFEDPPYDDGDYAEDLPAPWRDGYYWPSGSSDWVDYDYYAGIENPDTAYGGIVPEGENAAFQYSYYDGTYGGYDMGLRQILAATLEPDTHYELSVMVGNPETVASNDYLVELLAGGTVLNSSTGPSPAPDTWTATPVTVTYDSPSTVDVEQALEVRLVLVDDGSTDQVLHFDDVQLTATGSAYPRFVTLTLSVNDDVSSDEDTMTIDVYDDACKAAIIGLGEEYDPGDCDADCDTDIEDFAEMAETWLVDYTLTEPAEKP